MKKRIDPGYLISLLLSVVLAFVIGAVILAIAGFSPGKAYLAMLNGAFSSARHIGDLLEYAMVLCLCGLACVLGARVGIFNVGGEGQLLLGAIVACQVGVWLDGLTPWLVLPLAALAAMAAGGLYALIPGVLKITRGQNEMIVHNHHTEPWKVTVVDTGLNTMTGGRIKRIRPYIGNETFMMTYGDGVCDVDIAKLVAFHRENGKIATLTAVQQEQQKGVLDIAEDNSVRSFREKKASDGALINAGYMVLEPQIFDYLDGDACVFEQKPLQKLAEEGQLMSYIHKGFWQCMDTAREKQVLEKMLATGNAPWKKWED